MNLKMANRLLAKEPTDEVRIPVSLIMDSELSFGARICYSILAKTVCPFGQIRIGQRELALYMDRSRRSVRKYMDELVEKGWLE